MLAVEAPQAPNSYATITSNLNTNLTNALLSSCATTMACMLLTCWRQQSRIENCSLGSLITKELPIKASANISDSQRARLMCYLLCVGRITSLRPIERAPAHHDRPGTSGSQLAFLSGHLLRFYEKLTCYFGLSQSLANGSSSSLGIS